MSARTKAVQALQYELEVEIEAGRAEVWRALTDEVDAWWLPDFHMVGEGSRLTLDARAGGALLETREDGGSLLWYTVLLCVPGESLQMVGHVAPDWGGPATTMLKLVLEERGGTTLLRVSDALFGSVDEAQAASLREGWLELFGRGLKPYAEGNRA